MKLRSLGALVALAFHALLAGAAHAQQSSLAGKVFGAVGGKPVAAAEILVASLKLSTRSDSAGNYELGMVPPGSHEVTVRSIGFQPLNVRIEFVAEKVARANFQLTATGPTLETVNVKGALERRWADRLVEFDQRRQAGPGVYLTYDKLAKNSSMTVPALLRSFLPGIRILRLGGYEVAASSRGGRNCALQVLLNRMNMYNGESMYFDLNSIEAADLLGVEYYNAFVTPPEMSGKPRGPYGGSRCGTLVLWMK